MTPLAPTPRGTALLPVAPPQSAAQQDGRKVAEAFEAIILRQMLATMRQAKLGDDIFGSAATDNFRELADARVADTLAARQQFGIAALVQQQLAKTAGDLP